LYFAAFREAGRVHVDETQGRIDGHGHVAYLRRERHRIATAHVHQHLDLVEQIRRAWKGEARGAPGLRRRADAELAADADADAVFKKREVPAHADVELIVRTLGASYEDMGNLVWRGLSQEDQFPLIKELFDMARLRHRRWVETNFADAIGTARGAERERRTLLLLFAATDFYIWKLYRRDLDKSREFATDRMLDLVTAAIGSFRRAS
jgi:hypothetical protein